MRCVRCAVTGLVMAAGFAFAPRAHGQDGGGSPTPRPSKLVIVFEENKSFGQIFGNPSAPYMNQLAAEGTLFTSFYAITHPSQPNYFDFFSGTNQGCTDNTNPAPGTPFDTPNLASSLQHAGFSFIGYAEDLPWVGSTVPAWFYYTRLTNPWVNWQASGTPGTHQIVPSQNLPFSHFPADFTQLPDVSLIIPNLINNSHDGTIAQSDEWLFTRIKPFADWAMQNNGLLIVTYDEDEGPARNHIYTIFYGPMIRPGTNNATWTLHNLLRTVQDMYGAQPSGLAQRVRPMRGYAADGSDAVLARTFRNGVNGYSGTLDTYIEEENPTLAHGGETSVWTIDQPLRQSLISFGGIIGTAPWQVPPQTEILSAKLSFLTGVTTGSDRSFDTMFIHRMLVPWSEASTWDSMDDGVSTDDIECASQGEFSVIPNVGVAWAIFDVTDTVQAWVNDPASNLGWLIRSTGSDTWRWRSSEWGVFGDRPWLEIVTAQPPPPATFALVSPDTGAVHQSLQPTFTWEASGGAETYRVTIATDAALVSVVHSVSGLAGLSYAVPAGVLEICSGYHWGITAFNPFGFTPSSPLSRSFWTLLPADYNTDGFVDGIDYDQFNNDFQAGNMASDYNGDGFVDGIDYDQFNNDFEAGC